MYSLCGLNVDNHSEWRTSYRQQPNYLLTTLTAYFSFLFKLATKVLCFDLVHIRVFPGVCQDVKACVDVVEQVDYLDGPLS